LTSSIKKRTGGWLTSLTPVSFFILIAAIFGVIFILITPPFEAPDEPVHFFRAYQVSTLNLSVDKVGTVYGGVLPASLQQTVSETWDKSNLAFHPNYKYHLGYTKNALRIKNTGATHIYDFSTTAYYSPVSYAPQALGIGVGRLFKTSPIVMMYLGRLFNLTAWIAMFALAIKLMPRKKWVVVFIGLIPMALFQGASLSADVPAIGLLALTVAYVFMLCEWRRKMSKWNILILTTLLALVCLSKQIMFIFVALALLLPSKLFNGKKNEYLVKSLLITIPLLIAAIWDLHVYGIPQSNAVGGINPHAQESYILHNPLQYLNALNNVYFFNWGDGIVKSFFGNFGWADTPLSDGIVTVGYIALFLLVVANADSEKIWLSKGQRAFLAILAFVYILALSTALYVYFSPVGFKIVYGLVGRYYLPLAILLTPVFYGNWLKISSKAYRRIAIWAPTFLLICSTITILVRYYINNV
jgi:uncharacterized membrane protein